jgi:hypothetical protein
VVYNHDAVSDSGGVASKWATDGMTHGRTNVWLDTLFTTTSLFTTIGWMHTVGHTLHNHHAVYNHWVDAQGQTRSSQSPRCLQPVGGCTGSDTLFTITTLFTTSGWMHRVGHIVGWTHSSQPRRCLHKQWQRHTHKLRSLPLYFLSEDLICCRFS